MNVHSENVNFLSFWVRKVYGLVKRSNSSISPSGSMGGESIGSRFEKRERIIFRHFRTDQSRAYQIESESSEQDLVMLESQTPPLSILPHPQSSQRARLTARKARMLARWSRWHTTPGSPTCRLPDALSAARFLGLCLQSCPTRVTRWLVGYPAASYCAAYIRTWICQNMENIPSPARLSQIALNFYSNINDRCFGLWLSDANIAYVGNGFVVRCWDPFNLKGDSVKNSFLKCSLVIH